MPLLLKVQIPNINNYECPLTLEYPSGNHKVSKSLNNIFINAKGSTTDHTLCTWLLSIHIQNATSPVIINRFLAFIHWTPT
uniref:Uncharacterized protein n=1 Tax=Rhizophora mucronata TaxID=61149 RepID=A0A2P2KSH9_RHIMU